MDKGFVKIFFFMLMVFSAERVFAKQDFLFMDAPPSERVWAQQKEDTDKTMIKRSRYVLINEEPLRNRGPDVLTFNLFEDVVLQAIKSRVVVRTEDQYTWYGLIKNIKTNPVLLVVDHKNMMGQITMPGQIYQIRAVGRGVHAIYDIDSSKIPKDAPPLKVP